MYVLPKQNYQKKQKKLSTVTTPGGQNSIRDEVKIQNDEDLQKEIDYIGGDLIRKGVKYHKTREMLEMKEGVEPEYKGNSKYRQERDECDVQSLYSMLGDTISNPFSINKDEKGHLTNIATGMVLPDDMADKLVNARHKGDKLLQEFIEK